MFFDETSTDPAGVYREYYRAELAKVPEAVARVLRRGVLSNGPEVANFEIECARVMGTRYGIAVSSCTTGLMLALRLLAPRSRVIVPWFSFCATVLPILWNQGVAVFGKIDERTWNLEFEWARQALDSGEAGAILFLATAGSVAGLTAFEELAHFYRVPLIIDAAGAFGSHDDLSPGARETNYGSVSVVSFASKKPLPIGEGGMIFTNDPAIADALRKLRLYGSSDGFFCTAVGLNGRMSEVSAAIGRTFLKGFERTLTQRRLIAGSIFEQAGHNIHWQKIEHSCQSSYADLLAVVDRRVRARLIRSFESLGIEAVPFYDPSVALHPAFTSVDAALRIDVREQLLDYQGRTFAFRPASNMTLDQLKTIVNSLRDGSS